MTRALLPLLLLLAGCSGPASEPFVHVPLLGAHAALACSDCHGDVLEAVPTACQDCHEQDRPEGHYAGDCVDCHSESGWLPAIADHSFFPLESGHAVPTCVDCHGQGEPGPLDPTCESCHARPAGHFAGDCASCHDIVAWSNADFDHRPFFPIPHEGVNECAECHPSADAGNYSAFSCTDCHEHRRSRMDNEHLGEVSGYVYNSAACLDCHPDGEEDD